MHIKQTINLLPLQKKKSFKTIKLTFKYTEKNIENN